MSTEIVTITVMMIEWVTVEELMIAVTTYGAPGPRPPWELKHAHQA